jgi:cytochrome P450
MAMIIYAFESVAAMATSSANYSSFLSAKALAEHELGVEVHGAGSENPRSHILLIYTLLTILPVIAILVTFHSISPKSSQLPPGPPGWPLLGSIPWFFAARKTPATFAQFAHDIARYGEMTTVRMGARTWVFLNTPRVAKEIIAKHASSTSERPSLPVSSGLVSRNNRTVLKKTAQWTEGRQLMHHLLSGTATRKYGHIQEEESTRLLRSYAGKPEQWYRHHYDYAYAIIHRIVLGSKPQQTPDDLDAFRRVTVEFILSIYASVFDFFPGIGILQPGRGFWKRRGEDHARVFEKWWAPVKKDIDAPPSFVRDVLLRSDTNFARSNEEAMYLATSIVAAGSDNVRRAHNVLMMAVLCHPHVVEKARRDLDAVLGNAERLATIADMEALPYVSAIIKEAMRWRPVVPLIPSHHSTEQIHFEGYTFPAGTDFVINSSAVANVVARAEEFLPERWEGREMNITEDLWAFGGGRRVCVGYKIAHQELFLALANMIYCFDATPVSRCASFKSLSVANGCRLVQWIAGNSTISFKSRRFPCVCRREARHTRN